MCLFISAWLDQSSFQAFTFTSQYISVAVHYSFLFQYYQLAIYLPVNSAGSIYILLFIRVFHSCSHVLPSIYLFYLLVHPSVRPHINTSSINLFCSCSHVSPWSIIHEIIHFCLSFYPFVYTYVPLHINLSIYSTMLKWIKTGIINASVSRFLLPQLVSCCHILCSTNLQTSRISIGKSVEIRATVNPAMKCMGEGGEGCHAAEGGAHPRLIVAAHPADTDNNGAAWGTSHIHLA